ncbi:cytochrome-c peroxidase [Aeoliella mucimassa]|nr:cytochrome c peroxidase [Aeoliella mucimassa]
MSVVASEVRRHDSDEVNESKVADATEPRGMPDQRQQVGLPRVNSTTLENGNRITRGRSGFFERKPPREERTPEARTEYIEQLRDIYSKPPQQWPAPHVDHAVAWKEIGLLPELPPVDPESEAAARIELGKHLFFDPRLSASRQIACASCHDPDLAWGDGRTVSFGNERKMLTRNAPSIMNVRYSQVFFWDGRAESLEDQAHAVMLNPNEMGSSKSLVEGRLQSVPLYLELFQKAYPQEEITIEVASRAIADFERTIVGGRSRFDRFMKGDPNALSDEAMAGLDLFRREARCINCHHGPTFSDNQLHVVGLSYYGRKYEDLGQFEQTRRIEDVGRFKTPSLRNVSQTGPYMHNGLFPSIRGVLNMYNAGMPTLVPKNDQQMDDPFFPHKSPLLMPLGLNTQDLSDLESFLQSLEEPPLRVRPPERAEEAPSEGTTTSVAADYQD